MGRKLPQERLLKCLVKGIYIENNKTDLLEKFTNNEAKDYSGAVIFYDVNYKYEASDFLKNGERTNASVKVTVGNGGLSGSSNSSGGIISTLGCWDYYLITTWSDGTQTSQYLYRSCDATSGNSDAGGGGSSSPPPTPPTVEAVSNPTICLSSFKFSDFISTSNGILVVGKLRELTVSI